MNYTIMELIWLLLIYSFLGWVIETIVGTVKKKKFVNRGFSTGPFCLVYGTAAVFMAVTMEELRADPVFQLLGCGILATIIEWMAGKILERLNQHKWWDYSDKKWNFDGYICLQYSGIVGSSGISGSAVCQWIFDVLVSYDSGTDQGSSALGFDRRDASGYFCFTGSSVSYQKRNAHSDPVESESGSLDAEICLDDCWTCRKTNGKSVSCYFGEDGNTGKRGKVCRRMWILQIVLAVFDRSSAGRFYRNDFLPFDLRCLDEQEQSCMGTVQYCVGTCYCHCYRTVI